MTRRLTDGVESKRFSIPREKVPESCKHSSSVNESEKRFTFPKDFIKKHWKTVFLLENTSCTWLPNYPTAFLKLVFSSNCNILHEIIQTLFLFRFQWNVGKMFIEIEVSICIHKRKCREFVHLETYHFLIWLYYVLNTLSRWTLWTWNIPPHYFFLVELFSSANNMVRPLMSLPNLQITSSSITICIHNSSMVAIISKRSFTLSCDTSSSELMWRR